MNKQDFVKTQTCVFRLNVDCDGCKTKFKKLLQKIDGVYSVSIDTEQGKVAVTGNVDPAVLIQKLEKHGKHAELWGSSKTASFHPNNNQLMNLNNQLKNLHFDGGKMGKDHNNKSHKNGGGKEQQSKQQLFEQEMEKDFKMPINGNSNKMKDDGFDDEMMDGDGNDHVLKHPSSKNIPIEGSGKGEKKGKNVKRGKEGKKSGGMVGLLKGMLGVGGGKSDGKIKKGKDGKKDDKNGVSVILSNKHQNLGHGGGGGKYGGGGEGKIGKAHGDGFEGKSGKTQGGNVINHKGIPNNNKGNGKNNGGGDGPQNMQMMGLPSGQPMVNGGGYNQGMGPPMGGSYAQQQQYMAMMMNQQRMNGGDGYGMYQQPQAMMYGYPTMGMPYGTPMVPPAAYNDPFTSYFNDENTNSCIIM